MTYVITQNCCKDASCVPVCPVDCIRPSDGAQQLIGTEMLYIDPDACIDCGACLEACPVDAIYYDADLPEDQQRFLDINAAYFQRNPLEPAEPSPPVDRAAVEPGTLRVAVIGSGPAACYTAAELLRTDGVEVDIYERLPTPFGLIRAGVAPDHQHTKAVADMFSGALSSPRATCHFNVEVGRDIQHRELLGYHHAVIYAVGARTSRSLGLPGKDLPGNVSAADFVGWYNGHPDHANAEFDLSAERAVVIGNGNVALDVARVLLMPTDALEKTDIAQYALDALAGSKIREVTILGRRGIRDAAFSCGEFLALGHLPGIDIAISPAEFSTDSAGDVETQLKLDIARDYAARDPHPDHKRINFRFLTTPTEFVGSDRVTGLRVTDSRHGNDNGASEHTDEELIETSLVLRSIGHKGSALEGLPFDDPAGVIPNHGGRVVDDAGKPVPGVYVVGWIKRGPRGLIGSNRACAEETVAELWRDFDEGILERDVDDRAALDQLLQQRGVQPLDWKDWRTIDKAERKNGRAASRPRIKFVDVDDIIAAARQ